MLKPNAISILKQKRPNAHIKSIPKYKYAFFYTSFSVSALYVVFPSGFTLLCSCQLVLMLHCCNDLIKPKCFRKYTI